MFLNKFHFSRRLLDWYDKSRRDLPWRVPRGCKPDPYHILISETMLQQTQVRTVLPYFREFIRRWPSVSDLAGADEQAVLKAWQGLGYYSRARNLLATARQILSKHQAVIPADVPTLLSLPGIGRYTAGAVASIAYDTRAPIVDGNVARVICRLDCIRSDPRDRLTQQTLWRRAEGLLPPARAGDFNSALMELGSTVCTPRSPQCSLCPVQMHCQAFAEGMQNSIPAPRKSKPIPLVHRLTFCLRLRRSGSASAWLIEQRPGRGRWAGLWQFITTPAPAPPVSAKTVHAATGVRSTTPRHLGTIEHALTHRRYHFEVYRCDVRGNVPQLFDDAGAACVRRWVRLDELDRYPLPRPHARIVEILKKRG